MSTEFSMTERILACGASGVVVTLDDAVVAVFGPGAAQADRMRTSRIISTLVARNKLRRLGPQRFRVVALDSSEDEEPHRRLTTAVLESRLNRVVLALNAAHEEVSELRHELHVVERFEDSRPTFPMRCSRADEMDS